MTVHKHVLVINGNWFSCEGCTARLEVVPLIERAPGGARVTASARVRNGGRGGFTLDEMNEVCRFWLGRFRTQAQDHERLTRRERRSRRRSVSSGAPRLVGVWFDASGVDRSESVGGEG
jgi:hypothetical protein